MKDGYTTIWKTVINLTVKPVNKTPLATTYNIIAFSLHISRKFLAKKKGQEGGFVPPWNFGTCEQTTFVVKCRSIPWINPRLTFGWALDQHLDHYLVNTQLTSQLTVGWESTNFHRHAIECCEIHTCISRSVLSQLLTDFDRMPIMCWLRCQLSFSIVLTKCRSRCQLSTRQSRFWSSVYQGYWSPLNHDLNFQY